MNARRLVYAVMIVALSLAVLPTVAMADPIVDASVELPYKFAGANGAVGTMASGGTEIQCSSGVEASGEIENGSSGTAQLTFKGCKSSGTNCTTTGQAAGTIVTTVLSGRLKTINGGEPALLAQAPEGHFASFKCAFGLVSVKVTGTGIIVAITSPGYNEWSKSVTGELSVIEGKQQYTTVEGDETEYVLESSINGGAKQLATINAKTTITSTEGQEGMLTRE